MRKSVRARIRWIIPENGGRNRPVPSGVRYCPIVRFLHWPTDDSVTWSADFIATELDANLEMIVVFSFLSDEAPFDCLSGANQFELFEGSKKVAMGVVLGEVKS